MKSYEVESNGPVTNPVDFFDSSPEWPNTREFLSVFARSFQKRFYFALFAVGYDSVSGLNGFIKDR
jgi:hypothetical protein